MSGVQYPFLPKDRVIQYVASDNKFMQNAKTFAQEHSRDDVVKTGAVVVQDDKIIGRGANGSDYHKMHGCERVKRGIPTGQGYELCDGCHPKNHAEPRAIADARKRGQDTAGADLYLWGHWWACEPCWNAMIEAGIHNVYLLAGSERFFNKSHPENVFNRLFVDTK